MPKLRLVHTKPRDYDEWETEFDVEVNTPQKQAILRRLLQRRWLADRRADDDFDAEGDDASLVSLVRQWIDDFRRQAGDRNA
jgi:hypothetical protein